MGSEARRPGHPAEVTAGKLPAAPVVSTPHPLPTVGAGKLLKLAEAIRKSAPIVGVGLLLLTNLESQISKNDAGTVGCGLRAGASGSAGFLLCLALPAAPRPVTSQTALSWEQTMGEAGPTRNRKSGGRARREEGREGAWPRLKRGWGLGDHRKSNYARKRKGEAEVLGRDTGTKTTP